MRTFRVLSVNNQLCSVLCFLPLQPSSADGELQEDGTRSKALFEWCNGPLVTAMREGHMLLIDEISLADDSVLERLNSVLEPGRLLVLAEKGEPYLCSCFALAHMVLG